MFRIIKPALITSVFLLFSSGEPVTAQTKQIPENREQVQFSYAPLVKEVAPAVVNIYTQKLVRQSLNPFMNDPFFNRFFGDSFGFGGMTREHLERTLGSGVILNPDGLIVTNAHVIDRGQEITVMLNDGREFEAEIALMDEPSDLALLRIDTEGEKLPHVELKPSDSLEVGDIVLAIGNPFGVGQTVTSGIVSALARSTLNINDFNFFIQTDAAINPGNSGGPLVSLDGRVVGINTAIFSRDGGSMGLGFAVPSEIVASVIAAEQTGAVTKRGVIRPWAGISVQTVTSDIAASLDLDRPGGALISGMHDASPFKKAGLRQGDVVMKVGDERIDSPAEMKFRLAMVPIGEQAQITYLRKGRERTVFVDSIAPPDQPPRNEKQLSGDHPLNGATVANANPAVVEELGLDSTTDEGVVVTDVDRRAYARRIGLRPGTIILEINKSRVSSVNELESILTREAGRSDTWQIRVRTDGRVKTLVIR